jgi:hypothetical protein
MNPVTDASVLDALRAADPAARIRLADADATSAIRRARPLRPARRRWMRGAAVIAAVLAIGVPAGAVATGFAARTGWFGSPNPGGGPAVGTESDDSEWLNLDADDLPDVVAALYPEWLPLAPGVDRSDVVARVTESVTGMEGLGQETLVRGRFEFEVYRDWISAWITAHGVGDAPGQQRAAQVLQQAAGWPVTVATDGGGVTTLMRAYAERISAGDAEAAQTLAQVEGAPGWDGVDRGELAAEISHEALGEQP